MYHQLLTAQTLKTMHTVCIAHRGQERRNWSPAHLPGVCLGAVGGHGKAHKVAGIAQLFSRHRFMMSCTHTRPLIYGINTWSRLIAIMNDLLGLHAKADLSLQHIHVGATGTVNHLCKSQQPLQGQSLEQ